MIDRNDIDKLVVNAATDIANIIPYFEYSADEKVIGMIGAYYHCVKMIDIGALPNASNKNVNHGISNLRDLISIRGSAHNANYSSMFPLPAPTPTASNAVGITGFDSTKFIITTGINLSGFTGFVVLEYTRS